jgi:Methane oxygenase PmoA
MTGSRAFPRVQAIPAVGRASLRVDGLERAGYEFAEAGTRPYVFPLIGPSGASLTRMGHPNPIGHEHHKSVWFGHQSVAGINFWEDRPSTDVQIRHRCVRLYHDGDQWGGLVADLDWWAHGRSHLHHELILAIEPMSDGGYALDLQSRLDSSGGIPVDLGKTNFGFLGVRVAKTMSEQFGGGRVMSAQGSAGESALYGEPSTWVDYCGPSAAGRVEGICFMDHPANPGHPVRWHVRADGWMGASFNRDSRYGVARDHPLLLRYRLLVHPGQRSHGDLTRDWEVFAATPAYSIIPPHQGSLARLERSGPSI